jgi:beta-carotene 3-hydroxylase
MTALFILLVFFAALISMEGVAWFTHKYIMHGFLWRLHKDHHTGEHSPVEHNDWFSILFAIPSFLFIFLGLSNSNYYATAIGAGMSVYGILYFIVHDVFIHQRIPLLKQTKNAYLKALRRAHKIHHKQLHKWNTEAFGFLIVPKKYYQKTTNSLFDKTV